MLNTYFSRIGCLIIGTSGSVINVFLPNIFTIQYSPFFLILGIGWYYMKKKEKSDCSIDFLFSICINRFLYCKCISVLGLPRVV